MTCKGICICHKTQKRPSNWSLY